MKKKHLKAVKKLDQERDVRAKKVVGVWKRRTWKRGSRSGVVTPVTEPVTRAGSEDEGEGEEGDEDGNVDDEDGGRKMGLIRRRSEGVTVDVCITSPHSHSHPQNQIPNTLPTDAEANHYHTCIASSPITPPSFDCCYAKEIECAGYKAEEHGAGGGGIRW